MTDVQPPQGAPIEASPAPSRIPRLSLRPVLTRRYRVPRVGWVEARLWRMEVRPEERPASYAVSLADGSTRRLCLLGTDPSRAREILDLLARNTVTPFGLRDVLEELT